MRRCAIYLRVSTEGQEKHGTSLDTQLADCRAYAAQQGYVVVLERSDVYTGRSMSRAGLEEVLDAAQRGEVDVVVCAAIDRSSRDLADLLMMDRELEKANAQLEFVRDPRDRTPSGDLFFHVKGAFSQYEHSVIIERMRKGKLHVIRQGNVVNHSHIAYGYRYDYALSNLLIEETEAALIREIFEWIGEGGNSMLSMAHRLNARAVPPPQGGRLWRENTISRILQNEVYMGRWTYGKQRRVQRPRTPAHEGDPVDMADTINVKVPRPRSEWLSVPVPAIVSEELWQAANAQVRRNKALSSRNRRHPYLLAGLIRCAECGATMYGWHHGQDSDTAYYKCSGWAKRMKYKGHAPEDYGPPCTTKAVRTEAVEGAVWAEVMRQVLDEELITDMLAETAKHDPLKKPDTKARLASLSSLRASTDKEAERLLDLYLAGDLPRTTYTERMARIRKRLLTLAAEQEAIEAESADYQARQRAVNTLAQNIAQVRHALPTMQYEQKRALLLSLDLEVSVRRATPTSPKDGHTVDIFNLPKPVYSLPVPRPQGRWKNQWAKK